MRVHLHCHHSQVVPDRFLSMSQIELCTFAKTELIEIELFRFLTELF